MSVQKYATPPLVLIWIRTRQAHMRAFFRPHFGQFHLPQSRRTTAPLWSKAYPVGHTAFVIFRLAYFAAIIAFLTLSLSEMFYIIQATAWGLKETLFLGKKLGKKTIVPRRWASPGNARFQEGGQGSARPLVQWYVRTTNTRY